MKTKAIVIAAIAACLTSGAAFAQSYGYDSRDQRYERSDNRYYERSDSRYDDRNDNRYDRDYRDYRRGDRYQRRMRHEGAGPHRDIFVGERLPQEFWGGQSLVRNWQRRDLPAPRAGHTWKRVGNDYVMSSVSTGIIAAVVLNR